MRAGYATSGTWALALCCDTCCRTQWLRLPLSAAALAIAAGEWAARHAHETDGATTREEVTDG